MQGYLSQVKVANPLFWFNGRPNLLWGSRRLWQLDLEKTETNFYSYTKNQMRTIENKTSFLLPYMEI